MVFGARAKERAFADTDTGSDARAQKCTHTHTHTHDRTAAKQMYKNTLGIRARDLAFEGRTLHSCYTQAEVPELEISSSTTLVKGSSLDPIFK